MPEERRMTITSSPHLAPDDVARHTFGSVRRGFEPSEVRSYLESIAAGLRGIAERERQLLEELADAERRAANPVLDEPTLTSALGQETARVLHSAHEAASEMVAKAEAEAGRQLADAGEEVSRLRSSAEARVTEQAAEAEAAAAELRDRTDRETAAGLESARLEAEGLVSKARDECRAMVDEAQQLRARVLSDLSRRRKVLHAQIEQLRAGRERLAETIQGVRRSVDVIAEELFTAEDDARLAAETAGREAAVRLDESSPEELAAMLLADQAQAVSDERSEGGVGGGEQTAAPDEQAPASGTARTEADDRSGAPRASDEHGVEPATGGPEQTGTGEVESTVPTESVDALFAKIRAAREDPDPDPKASSSNGGRGGWPRSGEKTGGRSDGGPDDGGQLTDDGGALEEAPPDDGGAREEARRDDSGAREEAPPEDNPFAARRDEMTLPIVTTLARRLKRTLQDNQNDLLDKVRSNGSHWSPALLPEDTEQVDAYATAALPALEEAAEAGVSFAGTGASPPLPTDPLLGIAHDLAETVVGALRRRLSDDDGLADAEESVVAEHVGSAFREWKRERVERLAGDHVVAAFSVGSLSAIDAQPAAELEWVAVSADDAPCPDCEDNGLTGSQRPGEEFPTGHAHPPAHPGCRCLLVLAST